MSQDDNYHTSEEQGIHDNELGTFISYSIRGAEALRKHLESTIDFYVIPERAGGNLGMLRYE